MLVPQVVGFRLSGRLAEGATATDLVLTITQMLRERGVVGKFVEFFGDGLQGLPVADRATIANMAPEYGATMGYFPVDAETLAYLKFTGRPAELVALIESYYREQGLFYDGEDSSRAYTADIELDISSVVPSLAGPKRPQDRVELQNAKKSFTAVLGKQPKAVAVTSDGAGYTLSDGSVVIAAITSCTNTSNPSVMVAAGLVAKKAVERGLTSKPWVKTSLAPGSKVVTDYLEASGLNTPLDRLGFNLVGYGCTTCIGNSGPLREEIAGAIRKNDLLVVSVLSGNRNFEGRINQHVKANYLASPPLVVAYALAGRMDIDLLTEPIGEGADGSKVFLKDIWPTPEEVKETMRSSLKPSMFTDNYKSVFDGDATWQGLAVPPGERFDWDNDSTYIRPAPFFDGMSREPVGLSDFSGVRVLAMLGDSVTTDHISPAGSIPANGPAGEYLIAHGVDPKDFNSFGSRRGNHEVMMRGTFANIRLRNLLAPGTEGGVTIHPDVAEPVSIFEAATRYRKTNTPLMIIAGKEYGSGSSRDWAAKGPRLLGVKVVLAESYERIHRSNLIGMGVLPLQFEPGQSAVSLGLTGTESFQISGISDDIIPSARLRVTAVNGAGGKETFMTICRLDTPMEVEYYRHDGILRYVLRGLLA
jgi:aconitate hydratase